MQAYADQQFMLLGDNLLDVFEERLPEIVEELKKKGNLRDWLKMVNLDGMLPGKNNSPVFDRAKILIVGDVKVKENVIYAIAQRFGFGKERLELHLGYDEAKNFNFSKVQYNNNYKAVIFGALPHSCQGKGDHSSWIARMENTEGYPEVYRTRDLKITKSNLEEFFRCLSRESDVAA